MAKKDTEQSQELNTVEEEAQGLSEEKEPT